MTEVQNSNKRENETNTRLAKIAGVKPTTYKMGAKVLNSDNEDVKQRVLSGETSISAGYKELIQDKKAENLKTNYLYLFCDQLLYYIGALSIYIKYCDYKNDELMDLSNVVDSWHVEIDLYCNNDIYTLEKIDIIKKSEIRMCDFVKGAKSIGIL